MPTIHALLGRCAALYPDAPAFASLGQAPLSHRELLGKVEAAAARLGTGRVAVVMANGPAMAVVCLAAMARATCVPLNPALTEPELRALLVRLGAKRLVVDGGQPAARAAAAALGLPLVEAASVVGPAAGVGDAADAHLAGASVAGAGLAAGADALPVVGAERASAAAADAVALVLHTSGSTAEPKVVPLSHRNLLAAAANVARSLQLQPGERCLSALPLFHVGGLVDLLLAPLSTGGTVCFAAGMHADAVLTALRALRPHWLQAVPVMLHDLLQQGGDDGELRALRCVRSVSAPLPPALMHAFEQRFGVPVVEIYGMTETAGVIASNPLPPAVRKPGSVGIAAGPEIAVVDAAGHRLPAGERGEVRVRGDSVFAGYEGGGARLAGGEGAGLRDGWLCTGDEGFLDDDGYLFLSGRLGEVVNRGGQKIAPREVDEVVLQFPGVREAAAFAVPHPTLGQELALAVVRQPGADVDGAALLAFCRQRLAPYKLPRALQFVDALPRTPGGKLQRSRLQAAWTPAARQPAAPSDERQRLLVALWQQVLGVAAVGVDDDFFDLGGDSLQAAALARELQAQFGFEVPPALLYDHPTIAALEPQLAALVAAPQRDGGFDEAGMLAELRSFLSTWDGERPWRDALLVGCNGRGARPPMFFGVQGMGELRALAAALGPEQPLFGMRSLFLMAHKSDAYATALARHYAAEIARLVPQGPLCLGGYCAGGGIAARAAAALEAAGREVALLCLVEHPLPLPCGGRVALHFCRGGDTAAALRGRRWRAGGRRVERHAYRTAHDRLLTDPRFLRRLRQDLAAADRTPTPVQRSTA